MDNKNDEMKELQEGMELSQEKINKNKSQGQTTSELNGISAFFYMLATIFIVVSSITFLMMLSEQRDFLTIISPVFSGLIGGFILIAIGKVVDLLVKIERNTRK